MARISRERMSLEDGRIDNGVFKKWGETLVGGASGTNTTSSYTVNLENGNVFNLILNANCAFTFSNPAGSGSTGSFTLILTQDGTGSRTVTWPAAVRWQGGVEPTLTATAERKDIFSFFTTNGGTLWFGTIAGANFPTALSATGGTITTSGGYTIHTFTSSGTFTVSSGSNDVEYLVVAGGGGAGGNGGGGGGGGGVRTGTLQVSTGSYTVTVGDGGDQASSNTVTGSNGDNSVFGSITSLGGGGGASRDGGGGALSGGSGGGGGGRTSGNTDGHLAGSGTVGQGNNGGNGTGPSDLGTSAAGGGGGGAGAVGTAGASQAGGNGGNGTQSSISGSATYYGGGGGGGKTVNGTVGTGGLGGGANGAYGSQNHGTANTGGGGGGGSGGSPGGNPGNGGSGIVIVRYPTP